MDRFNEINNIVDVEFDEANSELLNDENINGKPLYYTCKQVAQIVGENESAIRYWAKVFEPILKIEVSNMTKKYTKTNIENLMFIKKLLKEDGMTVKQTLEYCSSKGFNTEEGLVDVSNPLAIKTFVEAMTVEVDKKFDLMQSNIIKQQQEMIDNLTQIIADNNIKVSESLCKTVDEVVSDKMDGYFNSLQEELAITRETNEKIDKIRESMESRKIENEKKGLFSRLFKK